MRQAKHTRFRIGFCGCGIVADLHASAVATHPKAELVSAFDIDPRRTQAFVAKWGGQPKTSFEGLLHDETLDAVLVLSPSAHHLTHALATLQAGKHVLVEKPVVLTSEDGRKLEAAASASGRVCMPGHNYLYIPEISRVRRAVRDGDLGDVRYIAITYSIAHTESVAARYDDVLHVVMPHHAYLVESILGPPTSVFAGRTEPAWTALANDDQCWMVLEYPPHTTALLFASMAVDDSSLDPWTLSVKAVGTRGSIAATWAAASLKGEGGERRLALYEESFRSQLEAFLQALAGREDALVSPLSDATSAAHLLQAAEEAVVRRCAVDLR